MAVEQPTDSTAAIESTTSTSSATYGAGPITDPYADRFFS